MEKYEKILKAFNTSTHYHNNLLCTNSYVSMDDIHTAIIIVGVNLDKPFNYYTIKAKQCAIDGQRRTTKLYKIISENLQRLIHSDICYFSLLDYGFTDEEMLLVNEIIDKIPQRESQFNNKKWKKLKESIKQKVAAYR